jgi:hypothetical protein
LRRRKVQQKREGPGTTAIPALQRRQWGGLVGLWVAETAIKIVKWFCLLGKLALCDPPAAPRVHLRHCHTHCKSHPAHSCTTGSSRASHSHNQAAGSCAIATSIPCPSRCTPMEQAHKSSNTFPCQNMAEIHSHTKSWISEKIKKNPHAAGADGSVPQSAL